MAPEFETDRVAWEQGRRCERQRCLEIVQRAAVEYGASGDHDFASVVEKLAENIKTAA